MDTTFEDYLLEVGIRALEYTYTDNELSAAHPYFHACWESGLSPYKALLFLEYQDFHKNPTNNV